MPAAVNFAADEGAGATPLRPLARAGVEARYIPAHFQNRPLYQFARRFRFGHIFPAISKKRPRSRPGPSAERVWAAICGDAIELLSTLREPCAK